MSAFLTTRWSLVLAARDEGGAAADALGELCRRYRQPVLAYLRASGHRGIEAEDLLQGFFLALLEKRYDRSADPARGRFRSFLLTALKAWLANAHDAAQALKRGGGIRHDDIDAHADRESSLGVDVSPERAFDRDFALTLIERALGRLQAEAEAGGRADLFAALSLHLVEPAEGGDYRRIAGGLGMTPNHVAVSVRRWRQRLAELVRAELADTLAEPAQVEGELAALRRGLAG